MKKRKSQRSSGSAPRAADGFAAEDPLLKGALANILFQNVPPEIVTRYLPHFSRSEHKAGEVIFDEYSGGRDLYLIVSGRIRIKKYTKFGVESLLAVLHPGDFFGELSVVDGLPRSARAEAMDDCTLLGLTPATFRELLAENQEFRLNLLSNLGIRLRTMDQTFVLELGRNALAARTQMNHLARIVDASKIVNSTLDLDTLLSLILRVAAESTSADRGTLYLVDERTNELWSKIAQGSNMVEIRLPLGKGLAGYVAKTGETMNIADAYKDPRFNPEIDRKSGYRTKNVLCMPMRDKEGKIVGVFQLLNKRDGTFGREDEAFIDALSVHAAIAIENARIAREMVNSERLSAVGRMASTIIHDIKNPMGTLRVYAQIIKRKTDDAEASQLADVIIGQVDRFVTMTQEILDFSRGVSEIHLERVDLSEVMDSLVSFIEKDLLKRDIAIVHDFKCNRQVLLDLDKVSRVFYNLASNAADAMEHGGTLTIRTREQDSHAVFEFSDTGPGIPEEIQSRVFEPFFTSGKRRGTGLGLAIVKKIVDDHNGRIELESKPGHGTTFRLFFPLPPAS